MLLLIFEIRCSGVMNQLKALLLTSQICCAVDFVISAEWRSRKLPGIAAFCALSAGLDLIF